MSALGKSTLSIYRDCMRLIEHMAGHSPKATNVKNHVRDLFRLHRNETDPEQIENLRNQAMQGLANYLTVESLSRLKRKGFTQPVSAAAIAAEAASMNQHANAMYGEVSMEPEEKK